MTKFKLNVSMTSMMEAIIEAESAEEAEEIFSEMDGADPRLWETDCHWEINNIERMETAGG